MYTVRYMSRPSSCSQCPQFTPDHPPHPLTFCIHLGFHRPLRRPGDRGIAPRRQQGLTFRVMPVLSALLYVIFPEEPHGCGRCRRWKSELCSHRASAANYTERLFLKLKNGFCSGVVCVWKTQWALGLEVCIGPHGYCKS